MKKINKIFLLFIFINLLTSCGGLSDAAKTLKNEKTVTTDEFLVKKRDPLTLPPEYDKLPEPGALKSTKNNEGKSIDKILKMTNEKNPQKNSSSSVEQSIINKIGK